MELTLTKTTSKTKIQGAALAALPTEAVNPATRGLDRMSTRQVVGALQHEDAKVAAAVRRCLPAVVRAVEGMRPRFLAGGRVIYVGAGSSGRMGVLDAAECPPTFGLAPGRVVGVIAGGARALTGSIEGAEDSAAQGRRDMQKLRLTPLDTVVGIAASGRTPYTVAALRAAAGSGCWTVALTAAAGSPLGQMAAVVIQPATGAEAIAGSTRLKAGTAQKMVLNLLSTALMVRTGYVRDNLMARVQPSNAKLRARARRIQAALR